jgi:hypothetical protein
MGRHPFIRCSTFIPALDETHHSGKLIEYSTVVYQDRVADEILQAG